MRAKDGIDICITFFQINFYPVERITDIDSSHESLKSARGINFPEADHNICAGDEFADLRKEVLEILFFANL